MAAAAADPSAVAAAQVLVEIVAVLPPWVAVAVVVRAGDHVGPDVAGGGGDLPPPGIHRDPAGQGVGCRGSQANAGQNEVGILCSLVFDFQC